MPLPPDDASHRAEALTRQTRLAGRRLLSVRIPCETLAMRRRKQRSLISFSLTDSGARIEWAGIQFGRKKGSSPSLTVHCAKRTTGEKKVLHCRPKGKQEVRRCGLRHETEQTVEEDGTRDGRMISRWSTAGRCLRGPRVSHRVQAASQCVILLFFPLEADA